MPTIEIDDTTLHYERSGHGPAMLFVHGLCGDADVWADQAARFADRCTCVRYDRRGYTRSRPGQAALTTARHADDAAALVTALGLAPCLLVGSSSGASIGVDVARRHGRLLRGVVLSEPPLYGLDPEAGEQTLPDVRAIVERTRASSGPRAAIDAFFQRMCPGLWSALDDDGKRRYLDNAETGLAELGSPPAALTAEALTGITTPALVIAGTLSDPALRSVARRLAGAWPDARFVELEASGHVTYAERPADFARAVAAFASELDRRASVAPVHAAGGARR